MPISTLNSNEKKIVEATIKVLERRNCANRQSVTVPEETRIGPPVECRFSINGKYYAIEHTMIQSFANQTWSNKIADEISVSLIPILENLQLPKIGIYFFGLPADLTALSSRQNLQMFLSLVGNWICEEAKSISDRFAIFQDSKKVRLPSSTTQIAGTTVSLFLSTGRFPKHYKLGQLQIRRIGPANLEDDRLKVVIGSLEKKLPKLAKCKQTGDHTILVLEDGDISLSNDQLICEALAKAANSHTQLPDEIMCVNTSVDSLWMITPLYGTGRFNPDLPEYLFDPAAMQFTE